MSFVGTFPTVDRARAKVRASHYRDETEILEPLLRDAALARRSGPARHRSRAPVGGAGPRR